MAFDSVKFRTCSSLVVRFFVAELLVNVNSVWGNTGPLRSLIDLRISNLIVKGLEIYGIVFVVCGIHSEK